MTFLLSGSYNASNALDLKNFVVNLNTNYTITSLTGIITTLKVEFTLTTLDINSLITAINLLLSSYPTVAILTFQQII